MASYDDRQRNHEATRTYGLADLLDGRAAGARRPGGRSDHDLARNPPDHSGRDAARHSVRALLRGGNVRVYRRDGAHLRRPGRLTPECLLPEPDVCRRARYLSTVSTFNQREVIKILSPR